ncbi:Maintenance of ploidy protein mob2 [Escovopsis weberi]|uniref:Maintenance of ploidy protein mob2 n=1 Tax=Escovopsis weberi TaxID=150374 RepID=A0A0M8MZF5_ESCWE|nr:Maintenance of ploidy protein mob2 [Escovopsis weberi]
MSNLFFGIKDRVRGAKVAGPSTRTGHDATPPRGPNTPHHAAAANAGAASASAAGRAAVAHLSTPQYVSSPVVSPPPPSLPRVPMPETLSLIKAIEGAPPTVDLPRPLPMWLNPACAKHIVKGNFLTLSTRPKTVERGEWVAHQVVEHFRNLWNFVRVVHEKEEDGTSICNPVSCPKMSAGRSHSYTWLNRNHEPVELPAHEYMTLMHRWMSGKTDDTAIFPTDAATCSFEPNPDLGGGPGPATSAYSNSSAAPAEWLGQRSGFPQGFSGTCQLIFRQIFRVYAHLYWDHFVEPFHHLSIERALNSCFSHFLLTATTLDMLKPAELEPMQYLIDLWAADGTFPPESRAYSYANVARGRYILSLNPGA